MPLGRRLAPPLFLAVSVLLLLCSCCQAACPPGWSVRSGTRYCYYTSPVHISWYDARATCLSLQSDLVSIADSSEGAFVADLLHPREPCWLGLNDRDVEGVFQWSDGTNSTYRNWAPREPSGGDGEDVVTMLSSGDVAQKWANVRYTFQHRFVCKMTDV